MTLEDDLDRIIVALKKLCTETGDDEWHNIIDKHATVIKRAMRPAVNQTKKGKKVFEKRDYTLIRDEDSKAILGYFRGQDDTDLEHELLTYRKSRMVLDPTFLPFYIDQGVSSILWFGVRLFKRSKRIEMVHAIDTPETLAHYIMNNKSQEEEE